MILLLFIDHMSPPNCVHYRSRSVHFEHTTLIDVIETIVFLVSVPSSRSFYTPLKYRCLITDHITLVGPNVL